MRSIKQGLFFFLFITIFVLGSASRVEAEEMAALIEEDGISQPRSLVVADVNVTDVNVTEVEGKLMGTFALQGKMGQQNDIVYGVTVTDTDGKLLLVAPLGKDLSVEEGEVKTLPIEYLLPSWLYGKVSVWIKAETADGLPLGTQLLLEKDFSTTAEQLAFFCTRSESGTDFSCTHKTGGSLRIAYYAGSVLGASTGEQTMVFEAGVSKTIVPTVGSGRYAVMVRDANTEAMTFVSIRMPGDFGVIRNVAIAADKVSGEIRGIATVELSSVKLAPKLEVSMVTTEGRSCGEQLVAEIRDGVGEFVAPTRECRQGTVTMTLKSTAGVTLDTLSQEFNIGSQIVRTESMTPNQDVSEQEVVQSALPWLKWLVWALGIGLLGVVVFSRAKTIMRGKGTTMKFFLGIVVCGALLGLSGESVQAATLRPSSVIGYIGEIGYVTTVTVNTDKSSYAPGESINVAANINIWTDAGAGGASSTSAQTRFRGTAGSPDWNQPWSGTATITGIGSLVTTSMGTNVFPGSDFTRTRTLTAPATAGAYSLAVNARACSAYPPLYFSAMQCRDDSGTISFSVDAPAPTKSLTISPSSPRPFGTNVTWTLTSTGAQSCEVIENPGNTTIITKASGTTNTSMSSSVTGVGTWTYSTQCWSGPNGTGTASAIESDTYTITAAAIVNGTCGTADGRTYDVDDSIIPVGNRCATGTYNQTKWGTDAGAWYTTTTFPAGAEPYNTGGADAAYYLGRFWSCDGSNGGATRGCRLSYQPQCGGADGTGPLASAPGNSTALQKMALCQIGTASSVTTNASSYDWSCSNGAGPTVSCSASRPVTVTRTAQITARVVTAYEQQSLWKKFISFVIGRDHVAQATGPNVTISPTTGVAGITWSSTGFSGSQCSVTGPGVSSFTTGGVRSLNGSDLGAGTTNVYTIQCNSGSSGVITDSVTVNVSAAPPGGGGCCGTGGGSDDVPNLTVTPSATCGSGLINLSWSTISGATSYQLRDGSTIIYNGSNTSFSHTGLSAASSHSYSVRSSGASGSSSYSGSITRSAPSACVSGSYTITVSAGSGGSISPSGPVIGVSAGGSQSFTISPAGGYAINRVRVDGMVVSGAPASYTFNNVSANHTIDATFTAVTGPRCLTPMSNNASVHSGDNTGLSVDTPYSYSATNTAPKCQYYCDANFTWDGDECAPDDLGFICTGIRPANTVRHSGDETGLTANVSWRYSLGNSSRKCEYRCRAGYDWDPIGRTCDGPSVSLSASPNSITAGDTSTLTWTPSANVTSCWASNGTAPWENTWVSPTGGNMTVSPLVTTTYSIECWNGSGLSTGVRNRVITVAAPAVPWADITVGTCQIVDNDSTCLAPISWNSTDLTGPVSVRQDGVEFSASPIVLPTANLTIPLTHTVVGNTFTFAHEGADLDTVTAGATCSGSAVWNGACTPVSAPTETCGDHATEISNTCVGTNYTLTDDTGVEQNCPGTRSCDYNWKEVSP